MAWTNVSACAILELFVIVFQVIGVGALCLSRLLPHTSSRWVYRGRVGFVFAMVGLGIAGALCGRFDSEFALFAGGTMTLLLIGMTSGSGQVDASVIARGRMAAEPNLAG